MNTPEISIYPDQSEEGPVSVFPLPYQGSSNVRVEMFDKWGRRVKSVLYIHVPGDTAVVVELKDLLGVPFPNGCYEMAVSTREGTGRGKVVVSRKKEEEIGTQPDGCLSASRMSI